jgi:hypothetical protein
MSTPAFVVLVLLAAVFARSAGRARRRRSGWGVFLAWVLAGFLSAFASVSFAIGLLVLPLAVVAIVAASRLAVWPEVSGFVGGVGLAAVLIALLSLGEPDGYGAWFALGVASAVAATVAFAALRRVTGVATPRRR